MKEHGLLKRAILIYNELLSPHLKHSDKKILKLFHSTAFIIEKFIHEHHEITEELEIFPIIHKRSKSTGIKYLVNILIRQHQKVRENTQKILSSKKLDVVKKEAKDFIRTYNAHGTREDTEIFPEFNKLISKEELMELSNRMEEVEEKRFRKNGFENILNIMKKIEKVLGIDKLEFYS